MNRLIQKIKDVLFHRSTSTITDDISNSDHLMLIYREGYQDGLEESKRKMYSDLEEQNAYSLGYLEGYRDF